MSLGRKDFAPETMQRKACSEASAGVGVRSSSEKRFGCWKKAFLNLGYQKFLHPAHRADVPLSNQPVTHDYGSCRNCFFTWER